MSQEPHEQRLARRRERPVGPDRLKLGFLLDQIVGPPSETTPVEPPAAGSKGGAHTARLLDKRSVKDATEHDRFLSEEDANELLKEVGRPSLIEALERIFDLAALHIRFERQEPLVDVDCLRAWHMLTERIDPDVLICFELVQRGWGGEVAELTNWGLAPSIGERDILQIADRGLTDLHVHVGGLRSAQTEWLNLMTGLEDLRGLSYFDDPTAPDKTERDALAAACRYLAKLRSENAPLFDDHKLRRTALQFDRFSPLTPDAPLPERLRRERQMMVQALIALKEHGTPFGDVQDAAVRWMIQVKSRFICRLQQTTETGRGLARFRGKFHATKRKRRLGRSGAYRAAWLDSKDLQADLANAFFVLQPSLRRLRKIELRRAPLPSKQDYRRLLQTWLCYRQSTPALNSCEVRFAIHFKRSLSRHDQTSLENFHTILDRDSARLHEFRREAVQSEPHLAGLISRSDFAGQERDLPAHHAAFAMNLLRGHPRSIDALNRLAAADEKEARIALERRRHAAWLALHRQEKVAPPLKPSGLGVTCHAGEDFAQPLEGLFEIWSAITLLAMRPGDSIGHGLALGVDPEQDRAERGAKTVTRRGKQFDALVWLYTLAMREHPDRHGGPTHQLEDFLWREAARIYNLGNISTLKVFDALNRSRAYPVSPSEEGTDAWTRPVEYLRRQEARAKVLQKRIALTPIAPVVDELDELVRWAQLKLYSDVQSRGVVIEFNPSSNWRISQAPTPSDLPFTRLLHAHGADILATVATDNPGVYGSRIETEYAIIFDALVKSGLRREEALNILERLRHVGCDRVYWGEPRERDAHADYSGG